MVLSSGCHPQQQLQLSSLAQACTNLRELVLSGAPVMDSPFSNFLELQLPAVFNTRSEEQPSSALQDKLGSSTFMGPSQEISPSWSSTG